MDRKKYNQCMAPFMRGSKTKDEHQRAMCIGAKLCTGKASTREEAEEICSQPRAPKIHGRRVHRPYDCEKEAGKLAKCLVEVIDMDMASNVNSIEVALLNALVECQCQK